MLSQFSSAYYYLHINKTGGSSLNSVFRSIFPESCVCPAGLAADLISIPPKKLPVYKYYSGHFGLSLPLMLPLIKRLRLRIFTILRDPVDRSLSQLNAFFRAKQGTYCSEFVHSVRCDVGECLKNKRIVDALSNYQSKSLAVPVSLNQLFSVNNDGGNFQELLARSSTNFTQDDLFMRAIRSARSFCFVGLTEKMDESCERLSSSLGISQIDSVPKVNVSNVNPLTGFRNSLRRSDVSSSVIRKLEDINRVDIKLYEHIASKW